MPAIEQYFPHDYREARHAFIAAAEANDLGVTSRLHPAENGADGKPLFLDTATIGERDAKTALLLISGTHGVEGYFGSGVQTGLLREGLAQRAAKGTKIVLLHALNPFGFSWDRRVNEDNADINRNFADFANPPRNPAYDELADAIALSDLSPGTMKAANAKLRAYSDKYGAFKLQEAISTGQYHHPGGIYFGGARESWSHRMLQDVFREELKGVKTLIAIDFHTGLGEHGAAEMITEDLPGSAAYKRAKTMWGDALQSSEAGESVSPPLQGTVDKAVAHWMKGRELTFAALEVGTRSTRDVFNALRRDNWLHLNAKPNDPDWARVKQEIRDAFYPDTADWKHSVWNHAAKAVDAALAAIA
ncbi:MAG: M14 family metallopeptidase [Proteobacteria bacterium]|nr:M14 family metallopeptidase [Pseudomonadota bacterium]